MRFSRRTILRGFGGLAIGLPWLEAIQGRARAQTAPARGPKRFVLFFDHGGTISASDRDGARYDGNGTNNGFDGWAPAPGEALKLGPIHQPLQPFVDSLMILRGVDNGAGHKQSPYGGDHGWANVTVLTQANVKKTGDSSYSVDGPSIDTELANRLAKKNPVTFPSINLLVPAHNYGTPFYRAANQPLSGEYSPLAAFNKLFAGVTDGTAPPDPAAVRARALRKSILDGVGEGLTQFQTRVSAADRMSIDAHLTHIRSLERQLDSSMVAPTCSKPVITGQDPKADVYSTNIEKSGPAQVDILIAALRCGLTNVATLEIGDFYAKFLNPTYPAAYDIGHSLDHSANDVGKKGTDAAHFAQWYDTILKNRQWRMGLTARFLAGLAATPEDGGTMLDNTLFFSTSEFSYGGVHSVVDMPVLLAGKAGGLLRTGRHLNFNLKAAADPATLTYQSKTSLQNLYTNFLNMFGYPDTSFGGTGYSAAPGPIAGLG
jgi:Protein of unknown function (DUF1552)